MSTAEGEQVVKLVSSDNIEIETGMYLRRLPRTSTARIPIRRLRAAEI
jgi:hypothetical protein